MLSVIAAFALVAWVAVRSRQGDWIERRVATLGALSFLWMTSASLIRPEVASESFIVQGPDAPWFFKLTGPELEVAAQREALVGLLGSVRVEGAE